MWEMGISHSRPHGYHKVSSKHEIYTSTKATKSRTKVSNLLNESSKNVFWLFAQTYLTFKHKHKADLMELGEIPLRPHHI